MPSKRFKHRARFKRKLPPVRVGKSPKPVYADMQVKQLEGGLWAVIEVEHDRIVIAGFPSNAAAWSWLDANTWDGRDALDRDHRIRAAFGRTR